MVVVATQTHTFWCSRETTRTLGAGERGGDGVGGWMAAVEWRRRGGA
nr:hypothetical protein [Tanacetum cinerariifolium]